MPVTFGIKLRGRVMVLEIVRHTCRYHRTGCQGCEYFGAQSGISFGTGLHIHFIEHL